MYKQLSAVIKAMTFDELKEPNAIAETLALILGKVATKRRSEVEYTLTKPSKSAIDKKESSGEITNRVQIVGNGSDDRVSVASATSNDRKRCSSISTA